MAVCPTFVILEFTSLPAPGTNFCMNQSVELWVENGRVAVTFFTLPLDNCIMGIKEVTLIPWATMANLCIMNN